VKDKWETYLAVNFSDWSSKPEVIIVFPNHEFGVSKYEALGKIYTLYTDKKPAALETEEILKGFGLDVTRASPWTMADGL